MFLFYLTVFKEPIALLMETVLFPSCWLHASNRTAYSSVRHSEQPDSLAVCLQNSKEEVEVEGLKGRQP